MDGGATTITIHGLTIEPGTQTVVVEGRPVALTRTEMRLLCCLAQRIGQTLTRRNLIDSVQGPDYPATDRTVDVQVAGLRKKLGTLGGIIETVRGVGYRIRA